MVLHNPNNWHWVNKDVSAWTKDYLDKDLVGIKTEKNGIIAEVTKVLSVDGDVDVSQRKGKVITIFDVRLQLEWNGSIPVKEEHENDDGTKEERDGKKDVSGTITIPEVAHDTEEDEYVFEVELYSSSLEKEPAKELVRKELTPQLRKHFQKLAPALIAEHGKDVQHAPNENPSSKFTPAKTYSTSGVEKSSEKSTTSASTSHNAGSVVNTTSLSDQQEFRTTAEQVYEVFTDPQRIAAFTRGTPKVFEGAKAGGKFEIFGGNVSGSYVKLEKPTYLEQKWRLAQWPAGHFSTLKIKFEQNDVDGVTIMRVDWEGVPIGQEEPTKRNWDEYYIRSIKTTFGFGTILKFNSEKYSDLKITCKGLSWDVHKAIVCPAAKFFEACCENFKEAAGGVIDLPDDNSDAVGALLRFLYTADYNDKITFDGPPSFMLFHVHVHTIGDKYNLPDLCKLAEAKFEERALKDWKSPAFAEAVKEMYATSPESKKSLQDCAVGIAINHAKELFEEDDSKLSEISLSVAPFAHAISKQLIASRSF